MSSLKQIAANRRNAQHSTGPTTAEGKQRSRRNAVRHGLTAETVIPNLEDAEDYQAFEAAVIADYDAETAVERELVLRLANVLWRLRRAGVIETALFASASGMDDGHSNVLPEPAPPLAIDDPDGRDATPVGQFSPGCEGTKNHSQDDQVVSIDPAPELAGRYLRLADLPTFPLDRLSRYEHLLWGQARGLVLTLESLRRRQGRQPRRSFPFAFRSRTSEVFTDETE